MRRAVGGAVEGAIAGIAEAAVIAAPRHDEVQPTLRIAHDAPGEGLRARDAGIAERPVLAGVRRLEDAAAEAGDVERARGVAQNVGGGGLRHAVILHPPGAPAIVGSDYPSG